MRNSQSYCLILILLLSLPILHFSDTSLPQISEQYDSAQSQDYWPTDGWRVSTPETQGMNSSYIEQLENYVNSYEMRLLRSVLVIRNGYIVSENYPMDDYTNESYHSTFGSGRSVLSAITGIALKNGNITSIHNSVLDYFTDRTIENLDVRKESITIEHLLSFTSGMTWDDHDDYVAMGESSDAVQYVLDRPMEAEPGEVWDTNSGGNILVQEIINITTGINHTLYTDIQLFKTLGIENYTWDPHLAMTPRDYAKILLLHLNNGTWDGEQLFPDDWVENSTRAYISGISKYDVSGDFGYCWYLKSNYNDSYFIENPWGPAGAAIWIFPSHNLIFLVTYQYKYDFDYMIRNYILPSVGEIGLIDPPEPVTTTNTTTETTSTPPTNATSGTPQNFDTLLLGLGATGSIAAVVLIVYFIKRRV